MKRFGWILAAYAVITLSHPALGSGAGTNEVLRVVLELSDGSSLIGVPGIESVPVQTSYAKMDVPLKHILSIKMADDHETASLDLRSGDKLKGVVSVGPVALDTLFGKATIGIEHIREFSVSRAAGALSESLRKGMLLYYSFDRDEGGKVTDGSGRKNSGEVKGAMWVRQGKAGGAYRVGRQKGCIQTSDQEAWSFGINPFSICLWVSLDVLPSGEQMLIGHDEGGGYRNKWVFGFSNGDLYFHINDVNGNSHRIAALPWTPKAGQWYHLAITRAGDTYGMFIDGKRVATGKNAQIIPQARAPLTLGHAEGLYVEGILDEVMLFDRALTDDEIGQICNAQQ